MILRLVPVLLACLVPVAGRAGPQGVSRGEAVE